jgi:hypothetical protein
VKAGGGNGIVADDDVTVTSSISSPRLLTLHALRLTGMGDAGKVARRFSLDGDEVAELLLDFEACGWVCRAEFAGFGGWTLTEAGKVENERQLADELAGSGATAGLAAAHGTFSPLNARFQTACTNWQIRPLPGQPMARNDHTDFRWDDRVIDELGTLGRRLAPLCAELSGRLARFEGYGDRYATAILRVEQGERAWVDGIGVDSCHTVWFELHEDLLASLGIQRGHEPS